MRIRICMRLDCAAGLGLYRKMCNEVGIKMNIHAEIFIPNIKRLNLCIFTNNSKTCGMTKFAHPFRIANIPEHSSYICHL